MLDQIKIKLIQDSVHTISNQAHKFHIGQETYSTATGV